METRSLSDGLMNIIFNDTETTACYLMACIAKQWEQSKAQSKIEFKHRQYKHRQYSIAQTV